MQTTDSNRYHDYVSNFDRQSHQVTLSSYCIGQTEVTQALWQAVMGSNPSYFKSDLNRPVEQVSWEKCQEFILRLNEMTGMHFRLPTQAEWEFAAHGGNLCKARQYSGSNNIDDVAWYSSNSGNTTHAVATKQPNELGIHDMNGNVWEWCLDFALIDDGYGSTFTTNRARRGGCWSSTPANCNVLIEGSSAPDDAYYRLGLRLALDEEDSFSLSESVIAVAVGETKTVQILNGDNHFSYIRQENEETEHVSATLDYHDLHVTGLQAGISTVRVETNAGYPLYLTVIVTPQGRH
jgi:formylglycine-generating enzyme required for sulfatase activity